MTYRIHRVAVLGAGTMGAAVAAHAANAGLSVDLLDIVPAGAEGKDRNSIVSAGFARRVKAKPAAPMDGSLARSTIASRIQSASLRRSKSSSKLPNRMCSWWSRNSS